MSNSMNSLVRSAIAGALFGAAIGVASMQDSCKSRKHRHRRHNTLMDKTGTALRSVGEDMQNVADMFDR